MRRQPSKRGRDASTGRLVFHIRVVHIHEVKHLERLGNWGVMRVSCALRVLWLGWVVHAPGAGL